MLDAAEAAKEKFSGLIRAVLRQDVSRTGAPLFRSLRRRERLYADTF